MKFDIIGIVGQGFVGGAIRDAFTNLIDDAELRVYTYDKYIDRLTTHSLPQLAEMSDIVFVCVPTPMNDDGSCDTSIVDDVVRTLNDESSRRPDDSRRLVVIIKSTIPPGTTDSLIERYRNIDIVFSPEFLNASTAYHDFISQEYVILGTNDDDVVYDLTDVFVTLLDIHPETVIGCKPIEAELLKYIKNAFFATKVSFANEMYQICEKLNVSYSHVMDMALLDDRMGWEHWQVPGPTPTPSGELSMGFGGACLPKDINAFMKLARELSVDPKVMDAAWRKNLEVRPGRDWEYVPGAVKNDKTDDDLSIM